MKKIIDMFDSKKEGFGMDKLEVEVNGVGNVFRDNINCEWEKESSLLMYEKCYGNYFFEYSNEYVNNLLIYDESSDVDCKGIVFDREFLFDWFLCKEFGV